eukprot:6682594-Karenia_brevis.AAC.1
MRLLAPATRCGGTKRVQPIPASSLDILKSLMPLEDIEDTADKFSQFVSECLRPLTPGERPASRETINN